MLTHTLTGLAKLISLRFVREEVLKRHLTWEIEENMRHFALVTFKAGIKRKHYNTEVLAHRATTSAEQKQLKHLDIPLVLKEQYRLHRDTQSFKSSFSASKLGVTMKRHPSCHHLTSAPGTTVPRRHHVARQQRLFVLELVNGSETPCQSAPRSHDTNPSALTEGHNYSFPALFLSIL